MDIYKASRQWADRPSDERFWTMEEMAQACRSYREHSCTATVNYQDLRVEARDQDLHLVGKAGVPATLTNYAFGQMCSRTREPAGFLRELPPTLAAQVLNHGLKTRAPDTSPAKLLFHRNGSMVLRAALSERYQRIWNHEVVERLMNILPDGWRVPPARPAMGGDVRARPATEADLLDDRFGSLSIGLGDMIAPAGLYASDHDMFVFLVNEQRIVDDGAGGMARFLMLWNSEVGDKKIGGMGGRYKHVCGNHIVWDAEGVFEFGFYHKGDVAEKWLGMRADIIEYSNASVSDEEAQIKAARSFELGANKEDVVEAIVKFARAKKLSGLADRAGDAYDTAERHQDWYGVAPTTVWGMVNGFTEVNQRTAFADERTKLDRAAGRLMEIAF